MIFQPQQKYLQMLNEKNISYSLNIKFANINNLLDNEEDNYKNIFKYIMKYFLKIRDIPKTLWNFTRDILYIEFQKTIKNFSVQL